MPDIHPALQIQNLLCDSNPLDDDRYTRSPSSQSESSSSNASMLSPRTPPTATFRMTFPIYPDNGPNCAHDFVPSEYQQQQSYCHLSNTDPLVHKVEPTSPYHRHHPYRMPPARGSYITINSDLICAHYLPIHNHSSIKAKRKRASPTQIMILEHVFGHTAFPSTGLREELGEKLGMEPRAVQIWFQNKRQSTKRDQWDTTLEQKQQKDQHKSNNQTFNHHSYPPYHHHQQPPHQE